MGTVAEAKDVKQERGPLSQAAISNAVTAACDLNEALSKLWRTVTEWYDPNIAAWSVSERAVLIFLAEAAQALYWLSCEDALDIEKTDLPH